MRFIIAILLGLVVSITIAFTSIHHPILDRFNPFLKTSIVMPKCQKVRNNMLILLPIMKEGKSLTIN